MRSEAAPVSYQNQNKILRIHRNSLTFLLQAGVAIGRPDDFFAEMLKNDEHMVKVKSRLLKQQVKIKTFEEKKPRSENKKFHKALKDFKMKNKHQQKKENFE